MHMTHNKINYLEVFHKHGYRVTRQRQVILDAICQANGHSSAAEIFYLARKLDESIDRSTIYRTLEVFVELGLVNRGENAEGIRVYEFIQEEPHHHLICKHCGVEIDIENQIVNDFYLELQQHYHYSVEMDHLIVFGVCPGCNQSE